jgi:cytochrome c oxidase subunit 4
MAHDTTLEPTMQGIGAHLEEEHAKYFTFFNLSLALIAITAIELIIVYVPIHPWVIVANLVFLSLVKFVGVVWWFMHLRWDRILCTVLFLIGLFLATGTVTALLLLFETAPGGVPGGSM